MTPTRPARSHCVHLGGRCLAALLLSSCAVPTPTVAAREEPRSIPALLSSVAPKSPLGTPKKTPVGKVPTGVKPSKAAGKLPGGYVLTHEHPVNALAFGGNYAFGGSAGNFQHGILKKGYTVPCGGCKAGKKCDHGEVKGNFTAAVGALGRDMGDHGSHMGPRHDSFSHLRYATDWIEAAHDHSTPLQIMVAFAVESEAMCEQLYYANKGNGGAGGDYGCSHGDTKASMKRQIDATKAWAKANSDWMEVAYSAKDARRIVNAGKLAIVLGVESDYAFGAEDRRFDPVSRLEYYYKLGVRTFYLAHKVNSRLAGADIYRSEDEVGGKIIRATQAMAGCFYVDDSVANFPLKNGKGHEFCNNKCGKGELEGGKVTDKCVSRYGELSEVNYADYFLGHGDDWFNGFDVYPKPPGFSGSAGSTTKSGVERNNLGLSHDGERVVRAAMRLGMIVNLDHVSSRSRQDIAQISKDFGGYPMNALHNSPNAMLVANSTSKLKTPGPNEYDFDDHELRLVKDSGGFFGVRVGPVDAANYPRSGVTTNCPKTATETAKILAYLLDKGLDVGYALDYATITEGVHSRTFAKCGTGLGGGDDFHKYGKHITEGLSHVGMMTKWHDELEDVGLKQKYLDKLENDGPEAFVRMWERSEAKRTKGSQIPRKTFTYDPPPDECRSNSDCGSKQYCGNPIAGMRRCKNKKSKGSACTAKHQCSSNKCSWGKCK